MVMLWYLVSFKRSWLACDFNVILIDDFPWEYYIIPTYQLGIPATFVTTAADD